MKIKQKDNERNRLEITRKFEEKVRKQDEQMTESNSVVNKGKSDFCPKLLPFIGKATQLPPLDYDPDHPTIRSNLNFSNRSFKHKFEPFTNQIEGPIYSSLIHLDLLNVLTRELHELLVVYRTNLFDKKTYLSYNQLSFF